MKHFLVTSLLKMLKRAYRESGELEEFETFEGTLEEIAGSVALELNRQRVYGEKSEIPVFVPEGIDRSEIEKLLEKEGFTSEEISRIIWVSKEDFEKTDEGQFVTEKAEEIIKSLTDEVEELEKTAVTDLGNSIKYSEGKLEVVDKTKFKRAIANYLVRPLIPYLYISLIHILMNYIDRLHSREVKTKSVRTEKPKVSPVNSFLKGLLWDCIADSSIVALSKKKLLVEALVTGNYDTIGSVFYGELKRRLSTIFTIFDLNIDENIIEEFVECCTGVFQEHLAGTLQPEKDLIAKISEIYLGNIYRSIYEVASLYSDETIELKGVTDSVRKGDLISLYQDKVKSIILSDDFEKELRDTFKDLPSIVDKNFPGTLLVERVTTFATDSSKLNNIIKWIFDNVKKEMNLASNEDIIPKDELLNRISNKIAENITDPRELYVVKEKVVINEPKFSGEVASRCENCSNRFISIINKIFEESGKEPFVIKKVKEVESVPPYEVSEVARTKEVLNFLFTKVKQFLVPLEFAEIGQFQEHYDRIKKSFESIGINADEILPKDISELISGPLRKYVEGISNQLYNVIEKCNSINTIYAFLYYSMQAYTDIFTELKSTLTLEEAAERLSNLIEHHIKKELLRQTEQGMKGTLKEGSLIKIGNDLFNVLKVEGDTMYLASYDMLESEGYSELYECPATLDYEVAGSFNYTVKRCPIDGVVVKKDAFCTNCPFGLSYDSCYTCVAKSLEKEAIKNARYPKVVTSQSSLLDNLLKSITFKTVKKPVTTKSSSVIVYDIVRHKTGHLGVVTDTNYDGSLKVYWPEIESSTIVWRQEVEKVDESLLK